MKISEIFNSDLMMEVQARLAANRLGCCFKLSGLSDPNDSGNVVATRLSASADGLGRIQVIGTTDKSTIGLAAAGSPSSQTPAFDNFVYPYSVWSPL